MAECGTASKGLTFSVRPAPNLRWKSFFLW